MYLYFSKHLFCVNAYLRSEEETSAPEGMRKRVVEAVNALSNYSQNLLDVDKHLLNRRSCFPMLTNAEIHLKQFSMCVRVRMRVSEMQKTDEHAKTMNSQQYLKSFCLAC